MTFFSLSGGNIYVLNGSVYVLCIVDAMVPKFADYYTIMLGYIKEFSSSWNEKWILNVKGTRHLYVHRINTLCMLRF
jgi:hypothetical protein